MSPARSRLYYSCRVETIDETTGNRVLALMPKAVSSDPPNIAVTNNSPPAAKIKLFRSLFRGREDVYPRRFQSRKTGKAGYAPACANECIRGVCEKPRITCTGCPSHP